MIVVGDGRDRILLNKPRSYGRWIGYGAAPPLPAIIEIAGAAGQTCGMRGLARVGGEKIVRRGSIESGAMVSARRARARRKRVR